MDTIQNQTQSETGRVIAELLERPVAFHPIFKKVTGSFSAAIVLSQIMYWQKTMKRGFYKTDEDFASELYMSLKEFRLAKEYIKKLPFIKLNRGWAHGKTTYDVNYDLLMACLKKSIDEIEQSCLPQIVQSEASCLPQMVQSISETTNTETNIPATVNTPTLFDGSKLSNLKPSHSPVRKNGTNKETLTAEMQYIKSIWGDLNKEKRDRGGIVVSKQKDYEKLFLEIGNLPLCIKVMDYLRSQQNLSAEYGWKDAAYNVGNLRNNWNKILEKADKKLQPSGFRI